MQDLSSIAEPAEREEAERAVKKRVLGNMRLISELYKQDMVKDWIMVTCIDELLTARPVKGAKMPPEDNIEVGPGGGRVARIWSRIRRASKACVMRGSCWEAGWGWGGWGWGQGIRARRGGEGQDGMVWGR